MSELTLKTQIRDKLDRPLRDLRISVIDKCNLRCTYCMPADEYHDGYRFLRKSERLTFHEIVRLTRLFVALGVSKVRITGGEPLLRKDLDQLIAMLRAIDGVEDLAMITNGLMLAQWARPLKEAGLDRVTISLDTLDDTLFGRMNGRGVGTNKVVEGIQAAEAAGLRPIKINVVVQRGINDRSVVDFAAVCKELGHIVRFIEYMDVGNRNGWKMEQVVPSKEIFRRIHDRFSLKPLQKSYHGEVAERYTYEDGSGEIGFISSVTQPFCRTCTRARLSADGKVYTCLFAAGGVDLRGALRGGASDEELLERMAAIWETRSDRYSELRSALRKKHPHEKKVEMYQIGG